MIDLFLAFAPEISCVMREESWEAKIQVRLLNFLLAESVHFFLVESTSNTKMGCLYLRVKKTKDYKLCR